MGFNDPKVTHAALIDVKFDTMWFEGLIYKLIKIEFPIHSIELKFIPIWKRENLASNWEIRSNTVFVNDGVPQGAILRPLLFIIFMIDHEYE